MVQYSGCLQTGWQARAGRGAERERREWSEKERLGGADKRGLRRAPPPLASVATVAPGHDVACTEEDAAAHARCNHGTATIFFSSEREARGK